MGKKVLNTKPLEWDLWCQVRKSVYSVKYKSMFYLAVPEVDVEVDKLTVFLHQVLHCALLKEVTGLLLHVKAVNNQTYYLYLIQSTKVINRWQH